MGGTVAITVRGVVDTASRSGAVDGAGGDGSVAVSPLWEAAAMATRATASTIRRCRRSSATGCPDRRRSRRIRRSRGPRSRPRSGPRSHGRGSRERGRSSRSSARTGRAGKAGGSSAKRLAPPRPGPLQYGLFMGLSPSLSHIRHLRNFFHAMVSTRPGSCRAVRCVGTPQPDRYGWCRRCSGDPFADRERPRECTGARVH